MQLDQDIRGDVAVLTVSKSMLTGPDVTPLHEGIKGLARDGIRKVVVDFSQAPWFGSAMLGVLIASLTTLRGVRGEIGVGGSREGMGSVLTVTGLDKVFQRADTVDRAVDSFKG